MILLDTDHLTVLRYPEDRRHDPLRLRLENVHDETIGTTVIGTTVICVEEQMRGWLALINRLRRFQEQIPAYGRLQKMIEFFEEWDVLPFDERAASECDRIRQKKARIGTQDLKIASIAIANDAMLLSANLRDFQKIPRLRVENWLES